MERKKMERKLGHFGLADFYAERRHCKHPGFLDAVEQLLDWTRIERKLKKKLRRSEENSAGVKAYPSLCMFKILLLQSWYELSDQAMEEALLDRYSFSRFVGISLDEDVPDHTTKGHMAVDTNQGFILTGHVTPANCSDTKEMKRLVRSSRLPRKSRVYAGKGFCSQANRDVLRKRKLKNGIMDKAARGDIPCLNVKSSATG